MTIITTHCAYPRRLCQAEWTWMAGYMAQDSLPGRRLSPTPPLTELNVEHYCYLIIRNAEASLVEIKSRDRHYKRILLLLCTHGCKYECKRCIFHVILTGRVLHLNSGIKFLKTLCY